MDAAKPAKTSSFREEFDLDQLKLDLPKPQPPSLVPSKRVRVKLYSQPNATDIEIIRYIKPENVKVDPDLGGQHPKTHPPLSSSRIGARSTWPAKISDVVGCGIPS
jgi:hypothetical protein